jgi:hypothetical protein
MVMKQKGNTLPDTTGRMPPAKRAGSVSQGIWMGGSTSKMPKANRTTTPILRNVTK